jgi:hypothetical protein
LLLALVLWSLPGPVFSQTQREREKTIQQRDQNTNGIVVGRPKVYDDSVLQQMLSAAEARLSGLQVLDQSSIASRLGSVTGASQQISSFGLSVQGPPLPSVATTSNGATKQVVDTVKSPTDTTVQTTTNAPVQNVVTTSPQVSAPSVTAPASSTTLPSSFNVSASDILNEQLQLTFEIANLRLLLEGSLTDRILRNSKKDVTLVKPRTTIGFPITISPDRRYKDAVAIVEVEVATNPNADASDSGEAPAIIALLPREKNYNVAAITDRSVSIGGGVVTQVASVAGSFFSGRKTYYIVQDQDTLALTFRPSPKDQNDKRRTGFLWQFRPVLGGSYVKAGLKQTFVQLAFPSPEGASTFGKIHIRTYWRKYDRKSDLLKEIIPGSLRENDTTEAPSQNLPEDADIPTFEMRQDISTFNPQHLEDLGNGQMLVTLTGNFLGGTYVRVGSTILQVGSPGFFTSEYRLIRFTAPIADLATKKTVVVTRDGTEVPLVISDTKTPIAVNIKPPSVTAIDEANSLLFIQLDHVHTLPNLPLVLVIGGKVFGYSDAPILRENDTLSVVLPTAFLISNPEVTVKPLMADDRPEMHQLAKAKLFDPSAELERLVLLEQGTTRLKYLLFGRRLKSAVVLVPVPQAPTSAADEPAKGAKAKGADKPQKSALPDIELKSVGSGTDDDTIRLLEVDANLAKTLKQVVLQRTGERPFVVTFPALPAAASAKQDPAFQERVTAGTDEAVIAGDDLGKVTQVFFQKQELNKTLDGKLLRVKGLVAAGVTTVAKTQSIDLKTATGTTTIKLEVVNSKVESVQK